MALVKVRKIDGTDGYVNPDQITHIAAAGNGQFKVHLAGGEMVVIVRESLDDLLTAGDGKP